MDPNGLLKILSKDPKTAAAKRYQQTVEKAVASFDSIDGWADYIAFLSRLHKALALPDHAHAVAWLPCAADIARCLQLCLLARLPNGVHRKALSVYDSVFSALTADAFNAGLPLWLPGLLPVWTFGSMQVKSELIAIYAHHIIPNATVETLKSVTHPLVLSLLAGLDHELAENFDDVLALIDSFKKKLANDSHFWRCLFLGIIANPEKRMGALSWCNKRLPVLTPIKDEAGALRYSDEATACLTPEPGLLIRALAATLNTATVFNTVGDIVVHRGFFDLLLTHLPLDSPVLANCPREKELLLMESARVTLDKDMSLNRRLWNWLLGPDSENVSENTAARARYLEINGLDMLSSGLLKCIDHDDTPISQKIETVKISLNLVIDKWEISHLLIPKLFSPVLKACYRASLSPQKSPDYDQLLITTQAFFNGVDTAYIWNDLVDYLLDPDTLGLAEFVLTHFDFDEQDMKSKHIPLALLILASNTTINQTWLNCASILISLSSASYLEPVDFGAGVLNSTSMVQDVKNYYNDLKNDETYEIPFNGAVLATSIYVAFRDILLKNRSNSRVVLSLADLLCQLLALLPANDTAFEDDLVINALLELPVSSGASTEEEIEHNLLLAFAATKLFKAFHDTTNTLNAGKIIKVICTNLWMSVISPDPTFYQVEAVKCLFELEMHSRSFHIEAAVSSLLLQSSHQDRVHAISALWSHASSTESDLILERPLQLVLDDLIDQNSAKNLAVCEFITTVVKSGSSNRLLKMITNPLLEFEFMQLEIEALCANHELSRFAYQLRTIINVIDTNVKTLKDAFNNEFAVMDNSSKLKIIKTNEWDISTYKSLLFYIIERFLSLAIADDLLADETLLEHYYNCVHNSLTLITYLVTGNESDFNDRFHALIENCSYYFSLSSAKSYQLELVQSRYLKLIFHMLKLSEDSKINLNLLHIEAEGHEPLLVHFIVEGIEKANTPVLLEGWVSLLTRALYLFNESVFSVILTLSPALIKKIDGYFRQIQQQEKINSSIVLDSSINILMSGLEDLLSICHSYLLTSKIRNRVDRNGSSVESGFFGNVIQGVFAIESPNTRTTEQNKLFSILLSFQDAINAGFKIWEWSDCKPKSTLHEGADKSMTHLANKLKFRAKKLLESLMDLERQEVIENLIQIDKECKSAIKLLNVLDGGRSQVTLPHIFNSILTRNYPSLVEESKRSHLNVDIEARDVSKFLVTYFQSIDTDTITDIWPFTMQFFKDVVNHQTHFKTLVPDLLRIINQLSAKLGSSKFGEEKKHKRDLADVFTKLLTAAATGKRIMFSSEPEPENEKEEGSDGEDSIEPTQDLQEELIDTLIDILGSLKSTIQDNDKMSSIVNVIIFNLITPQIKNRKVNDYPNRILPLLYKVGVVHPNRTWKATIQDAFMDNAFFSMTPTKASQWIDITKTWVAVDVEKFNELVSKVSTSSQASTSNLFSFNEKSELENKVYTVKRVAFILLIAPPDSYPPQANDLLDAIEALVLDAAVPAMYRCQISVLLRVLTLNFGEMHMMRRWAFIIQELISVFHNVLSKSLKELSTMPEDELQLVLNTCKLLDQLLLQRSDGFSLQEWIFVGNSSNFTDTKPTGASFALIDRIASEYDLTLIKAAPVPLHTVSDAPEPLLKGVSKISSIANLRTFFESLSLLNYERKHSIKDANTTACRDDVFADLLA